MCTCIACICACYFYANVVVSLPPEDLIYCLTQHTQLIRQTDQIHCEILQVQEST